MTKINRKHLRENVACDDIQYSKKNECWTFRQEFFYTNGYTSEKWAANISDQLMKLGFGVLVLDHGEVWKPFRGGASTRTSSHWYVTVSIKPLTAVAEAMPLTNPAHS